MRILVTGADGYLGIKIIPRLLNRGIEIYQVTHKNCDLTNKEQVSYLMQLVNPDRIIHCAAIVPKNEQQYNDRNSAFKSLEMLSNILCESTCPIFYISSMTAENPTSVYAQYKLKGEKLLETDGRAGMSIRLSGLFGLPRCNGLIYNMLNAIKNKQPFNLSYFIEWTGMHVDTAAEEIVKYATSYIDNYKLVTLKHDTMSRQFIESFVKLGEEIE